MKQKLIFLDIDGTLLPPGEMLIPQSTVEALHKAHANGHKLFLCTGRNLRMTQPLLDYGFDGAVCSAGGYVFCGDKVLVDLPMEPQLAQGVRSAMERHGVECTLEARDATYGSLKMIERWSFTHRDAGPLNSEAARWRKAMEDGMTMSPLGLCPEQDRLRHRRDPEGKGRRGTHQVLHRHGRRPEHPGCACCRV